MDERPLSSTILPHLPPGPRAFLALSDAFRRTLDLIHGPDSDEPAHLQKAILDGVAAIESMDRSRGVELRDAGSKLFGRLHTYEVDVTKRANDKAVAHYKQQQKKDAKKGDHDSGSADSIEWLDLLPEAEIEAMLVLDATTGRSLSARLAQAQRWEDFVRQGLSDPSKMLFVGPSGVGKTTAAHWMASKLGKRLAIIQVDKLVSSWVAKSGKNRRAVFRRVAQLGGVLFLDEIDAISGRRDKGGTGASADENRRITTALFQIIAKAPKGMIIIAATNLPELLDPALRRRMKTIVNFGYPDRVARVEMTRRAWAKLDLGASEAAREQLVRSTDGRSGAYLFDLADEAGREAIVAGVEVAQSHVFWALESVPVPDEFSNALTGKKAEPRATLIM